MKTIYILLILGQILMAATIQHIKVNGISVPLIYEEDKRLPLVTTQFIFTNSGSIADANISGLAKFSAKVLDEGTKKLGSSKFAEALESKAINISASTGTETFVFEMGCLKEQLSNGFKYLDELLKDPNYSDETINKVKTMTLGNLGRKENDYDYLASTQLKSILFGDTVLGRPSLGTVKSIKSIKLNEVEQFIKKHIVSSRLIVLVGGDVDLKKIKLQITKLIKELPKGKFEKVKHYSVVDKPEEKIMKKATKQAYIYFGSPYDINVTSPDYYKARVATYILGTGGFGSRLMEEIRVKRGLAYSAYARVHVSKSSSYFNGYLQTKLDTMSEAKQTVEDVIAKFVKSGVTKDELNETKKFLLGSEPLRVETMSQRLNRTFMEYYNGFKLGHSEKELELIKNLKLDDLNSYILKHREILQLSFSIVTE